MTRLDDGSSGSSGSPVSPSPRREFLGQLVTAAVAVAGTACAPGVAAATAGGGAAATTPSLAPRPVAEMGRKQTWDDSWTALLASAKHKAVFDSPEIGEGLALWQASLFLRGYQEALDAAEGEARPVIVMRHAGVPLAFGDALWEKYELAKMLKLKDPKTGRPFTRNPWLRPDPSAAAGASGSATLEGLRTRGAVLLACNLAAMGYAARIATRTKQDVATVREEVRSNLAPGVILQPSGVYATIRAQEMGAVFMRSV